MNSPRISYAPLARRKEPSLSTIGQFFSRYALESDRYFTSITPLAESPSCLGFLPRAYCGFACEVTRRATIDCVSSDDSNAVVSLALMNRRSETLSAYANKTPIMCLNVSRLSYTLEAFNFANRFDNPVREALDFFIKTDIKSLNTDKLESSVEIPPNLLFSNLLHTLRSCGYEQYIFSIAETLCLDVDLVKCRSTTRSSDPVKTLFRYRRLLAPSEVIVGSSSSSSINKSSGNKPATVRIGVITAVQNGDRWYVRTTKSNII